jgi:hypothetical protein
VSGEQNYEPYYPAPDSFLLVPWESLSPEQRRTINASNLYRAARLALQSGDADHMDEVADAIEAFNRRRA